MSPSAFERAVFEKHVIAFPPNVSFRGEPRNADGSELSAELLHWLAFVIDPVASGCQEIVLPQPERFTVGSDKVSPRTVINFSGMPNAVARTSGEGELEVHVGILFAFLSLPLTVRTINGLIGGPQVDVAALQRFRPSDAVMAELDGLMESWDESAASGWRLLALPQGATASAGDEWMATLKGMTSVLLGHELTHWFETIYKPAEWAQMMSGVRDHYHKWLGRNQQSSPQSIAEIEVILRREDVFENWVRETHADCGAYDYACATSTFGGSIRGAQAAPYIMRVNINMALFFALFTVCEMWMQLRGARVDVTTHPTAAIRRSVFYHVQAERLGMSEQDFLFRQFGAGAAVDYILDRIVAEYMTARS